MRRILTQRDVERAVLGGALLGGGGGGRMEAGRALGALAVGVGSPELWPLDEFRDEDLLVTVALVGAPAAAESHVGPVHYLRAVQALQSAIDGRIRGIIGNEMGPGTTVNGWFQASMLGIPVVDAPCDGRAHPTGVMGAAGLHLEPDYLSVQAAAGGRGERQIEATVRGFLSAASAAVRALSVEAGGLVAVARNPVTVAYARSHCAVGAVEEAIAIGERIQQSEAMGPAAMIAAQVDYLRGEVCCEGEARAIALETRGGFDVGTVAVGECELTFWNEYMTLERGGERLGTFPDLLVTFDRLTGLPIITAEMEQGREVAIARIPQERLRLGAGLRDPRLYAAAEAATGRDLVRYAFPSLRPA